MGIQTWDANGVPNNYGIKPISVVGIIDLLVDQKTGSYSFNFGTGPESWLYSRDCGGGKFDCVHKQKKHSCFR